MKKRLVALLIVSAFLISGCALAARFQEAKDAYLEQRVSELMEEDVPLQPVDEESLPIEDAEPEVMEEPQTVETEEAVPEETVEPVAEEEAETEETQEAEETEEAETEDDEDDADATPEAEDEEEETEADKTPEVESDDPGVFLGDPDWIDEMEPGEYYWNLATDEFMSAAYDDGTLRLQALSEVMGWRIASTPVLGDSYVEAVVKMGACSTSDGYGLVFHVPEKVAYNQGYFFGLTCDGKYSLRVWDGLSGENGQSVWLQYPHFSEYIVKGEDATNKLGVLTIGDTISIYINGEFVEEFVDDTYAEGFFGLYINRDRTENLTINVDQVSYWTDPLE